MKKIALLTLLLINLSLSFSLPRNQASPAIFSVTQSAGMILFRHTDSTQTIIPCRSVASIVSNADPSKIVSVWVVQQGDYDKIMQFDYSVCGFSTKQEAVDSVTVWASCVYVSDSAYTTILYTNTDSATITSYDVLNSQNTPPISPNTGDVYLVGNVPTGAWVGHAKDIAEWDGADWVFTDGVQGDFLYNATNALTYIFRSGNWVQTTGIPALNNGNIISSGLRIGTNNARSLTFETNNVNRGRFDSVGRFYVYDTSLRKSNKYLQIDSITGRLVASDISGGAGSSTLALDKISDAIDSNTINNGNYKQEWQWNSLANNTGFKLSSTSGGLLNTQNRLFEVQMSGAMPGAGNSSYAGYFKNTQAVGDGTGLYAEGTGTAINAVGAINIQSGALQLGGGSGALFYRSSGTTFLQAGAGEQLLLVSQNATAGNINLNCSTGANDVGFQIAKKTIYQHYVYGLGGARYNGNYVSANSTSACLIERNANKIIFSANSGLPGGGTAAFTPNNILTINGGSTLATSNVGIGTTTPDASAKLEVSSTTSGFLPPRMTATQASAISTPAQGLLLFVSDTNGTFTSVGWWGYNGSTWEKLNN